MRYLLELEGEGDDGQVTGTVAVAGGVPVDFSGWLELLRLLGGDLARSGPPAAGAQPAVRAEEHP